MRRQRYTHTLADTTYSTRQDELEEASNYSSVSTLAPRLPEQLNWMSYPYEDVNIQQHRNQLIQCQCRNAFNLNPIFIFTDICGIHSNLYQLNLSHPHYAVGNPSNYICYGTSGQRRSNLEDAHHSNDQNDNNIADGQFPSPSSPLQHDIPANLAVSDYRTVFLILRNGIRVDITPQKAVYVSNILGHCVGVLGSSAEESCIIHRNGKILEESSTIVMESYDKSAKICQKGVIFTSAYHALAYLVDASGTKSTSEKFKKFDYNYSFKIFYGNGCNAGGNPRSKCQSLISNSTYRNYGNGEAIYVIGDIKIKQNSRSEVRVTATSSRRILQTSVQFMKISTPLGYMKVDCDPIMHVHVEKEDKIIAAGRKGLTVRNGSQRAGLNRNNHLVVW